MPRLSTLLLPLAVTPDGALASVVGAARVLQGVALYFGTPRGSRCLVPEFGYPPLAFYDGALPAWIADAGAGLRLVAGVTDTRFDVALVDGIITGRVVVTTSGGEETLYDFTLNGT